MIVLWAIGLVLAVEGLVFALAPLRIEEALRAGGTVGGSAADAGAGHGGGVFAIWVARALA
jgi:uncharacterized membrane protein